MVHRRRPLRCVIVDSDDAVRRVMRLALADCDVVAERLTSQPDVISACGRCAADVLFFEPDMCGFDPVAALAALGADGFRGAVQLVSGDHGMLSQLKRAGEQRGLTMLPPLRKPFRASDIRRICAGLRDHAVALRPRDACVALTPSSGAGPRPVDGS